MYLALGNESSIKVGHYKNTIFNFHLYFKYMIIISLDVDWF